MNKKDTILIVYPPGGYGTFVEWCFNYFSGQITTLPFKPNGSSHLFDGNQFDQAGRRTKTTLEYINSKECYRFARTHNNLMIEEAVDSVQHVVLLMPTKDTRLLVLNNAVDKILYIDQVTNYIQHFVKTHNQFDYDLDNLERWQQREILSYWFNGADDYDQQYQTTKSIIKIPISNLIAEFESSIAYLLNACNIKPTNFENITNIKNKWLSLQRHTIKDQLINQIVKSTVNGICYQWDSELSVIDEAYIQWQLRELHNLDLMCYSVNVFPTDTTNLMKLLN